MTTWLSMIGVAFAALVAMWFGGRRAGKNAVKLDAAEQELDAHDRINKADVGAGLSDGDRVKRLRDYSKRHGN